MKAWMPSRLLLAVLVVQSFSLKAQKEPRQVYGFGAAFHEGWIWAHTLSMRHLVTGFVPAVELNFNVRTDGRKAWHHHLNFPVYGISFLAQDFRDGRMGKSWSLNPYLDLALRRGEKGSLYLRSATGLIYLSKPFDPDHNFSNIAVGSHFNCVIQYSAVYRYSITPALSADAGITFTHFSNGANRYPNLGVNVPSLRLGLNWYTGKVDYVQEPANSPEKETGSWYLYASAGLKAVQAGDPLRLPVYRFSVQRSHYLSPVSGLLLTADGFYHEVLARGLKAGSDNPGKDPFRAGLAAHYLLRVGKLEYQFGMGAYLFAPYRGDGIFYHRLGIRYRFSKRLGASFTLKTHFAIADNLALGLFWKIR